MNRSRGAAGALPQALTKADAAAALRCSEKTVQRRVAAGELDCIRDSAKRLLFLPEHIEAYFARNLATAQPKTRKPSRNPKYL